MPPQEGPSPELKTLNHPGQCSEHPWDKVIKLLFMGGEAKTQRWLSNLCKALQLGNITVGIEKPHSLGSKLHHFNSSILFPWHLSLAFYSCLDGPNWLEWEEESLRVRWNPLQAVLRISSVILQLNSSYFQETWSCLQRGSMLQREYTPFHHPEI